ncbi:MAG: hypothetical protein NTW86_12390 [Candidatus Sumerlaeota bacterium]|nr:hypothetical protein [Candidatus Sumerlaeota bacterium]
MYAVKGVYDGRAARPLEPVHARANAPVIITFLDEDAGAGLFPPTRLEDVAGCLRYAGPPKTLKDMDEAIGKSFVSRSLGLGQCPVVEP